MATEIGGAVELGPYLYTVRIDLLLEWLNPKGLFGMDHKTTTNINRVVENPNNQFTGYVYFLSSTYGKDLLGYYANYLGVYASEEEVDKTLPKVPSLKTGKPIYQKKEREIFKRVATSRTPHQLDHWKEETIHKIGEIGRCHQTGVWPKHTNYCTAFASKCMYLDLCQADDKSILQPMIEAGLYAESPWIPYGEVEGGGVEGGEENGKETN